MGRLDRIFTVGMSSKIAMVGATEKLGKIRAVGGIAGRGLGLGLRAYGAAMGDPLSIALLGVDAIAVGAKLTKFGMAGKAGVKGVDVASKAGISGLSGIMATAEQAEKAGIASRLGGVAGRSLGIGLRVYGLAEGDPLEIALIGVDTARVGVELGKFGAKGVYRVAKFGAEFGHGKGNIGKKFIHRQVLKADEVLLKRSGLYGKFKEGVTGTYRLGKTGAKYAYRIPKVFGGYIYTPIRESAARMALRIKGTRTYHFISRGYKLSRSAYGVLRAGPVETIKAGARVSYRIGHASAKFTYRQAIKVDKFLFQKSGFYGKLRQGMEGTYRIGRAGAKYAYRVPKVIGGYVYSASKGAALDALLRLKGTRAYRFGSKGYKLGQKTVGTARTGARATYQIGRAGALRAYRMSTAPFRLANRWAQQTARMAMRAMMHVARAIIAKLATMAAAVAAKIVAAISALLAPVAVPVLIGVVAVLIIVLLVYSIVGIIFPASIVMADEEPYLLYRDQIDWLDKDFQREIQELKAEKEALRRSGCKRTFAFYNAGVHIVYKNIVPDNHNIETDWQSILALSAVTHEQNINYAFCEQEFVEKIHKHLNYRKIKDIRNIPCPSGGNCMPYRVCYRSCSQGSCSTRCYTVPCCPGHYRLDIEVYIFALTDSLAKKEALDAGIPLEDFEEPEGETKRIVNEFIEGFEEEWWEQLATFDMDDVYPGVHMKQRVVPGLPQNWNAEWPLPPSYPIPQNWWGWRVVNASQTSSENETKEPLWKIYNPPDDPPAGLPDDWPEEWPYPPTYPPPYDWTPFPPGEIQSSHEVPDDPPEDLPDDWPESWPYPPTWPPPDDWTMYGIDCDGLEFSTTDNMSRELKKILQRLGYLPSEEEEEEANEEEGSNEDT
jgi:hypothetical protein